MFKWRQRNFKEENINNQDLHMVNSIYNMVAAKIDKMDSEKANPGTPMTNYQYGYQNAPMGAGGTNDFSVYDNRTTAPYLNYGILDSYYRTSWVAANIIDIPAEDMTRNWRKFKHADAKVVELREAAEKFYNVEKLILETKKWARLYGGAGIIFSFDTDTRQSLSEKMRYRAIEEGSLQFFQVVIKDQALPSGNYGMDPFLSDYLRPEFYTIASSAAGTQVHRDRIIIFQGKELPVYSKLMNVLWGDSVLAPILKLVDRAEGMLSAVDQLFRQANVDVVKLKDYTQILSKTPEKIIQRLGLDRKMISVWNKLCMDSEDEFVRNELGSLTGLAEVLKFFIQLLSAAPKIPFSRFIGESIKGFSEGDNEMKTYYEMIKKEQKSIDPQMRIIDTIIEMSAFGKIMNIEYEWNEIDKPGDKETADIDQVEANIDKTYLDAGIVSPYDVASRLANKGTYPTITGDTLGAYSKELNSPEEDLNPDGTDEFGGDDETKDTKTDKD